MGGLFCYLSLMNKIIFSALILTSLLASCTGSKDEQFCKCLKASEELNSFSSELLSGSVDQTKADKLNALKSAKKEACKDYSTMDGEEMLKRKKECTE